MQLLPFISECHVQIRQVTSAGIKTYCIVLHSLITIGKPGQKIHDFNLGGKNYAILEISSSGPGCG